MEAKATFYPSHVQLASGEMAQDADLKLGYQYNC
jgi:hypothetical protein